MSWITAFKALSWFQWGSGLVAIPIVGPILGFVFGLVQAVWLLIKTALKGATAILHNPYEICAVVVIAMLCIGLGLHWGVRWDAHLVKQAQSELGFVSMKMEGEDHADAALARAAVQARDAAEAGERARQEAERAATKLAQQPAPLSLLEPPSPPPVAVDPVLPVAAARADGGVAVNGVRDAQPAAAKGRGHKQKPGLLDGVFSGLGKAFDTSQW